MAVRCAAAGQDGAGRRSVGRWIWTAMLAQHTPTATCLGAGLSPAPAERRQPGGGKIRVWTTTDQRATSCMRPSRATREGRDVSQQRQLGRPRTDQPDLRGSADQSITACPTSERRLRARYLGRRLSLGVTARVPPAVRISQRGNQGRSLRAAHPGQRRALAGVEELGHDAPVPGHQAAAWSRCRARDVTGPASPRS